MLRIRLSRTGRKNAPSYRIIVADQKAARDGAHVDRIGHYNPTTDPMTLSIDSEKVTEIEEETEIDVSESEGEVEETVGAVVLVVVVVSSVVLEASSILLEPIPSSSYVICPHVFKNIPRMITKVIEMN